MNKNTLYLLAAALLLLPGCNKALDHADTGGITVEASIGTMTKVATDGAASNFEAGDKIAVYAWTGSAAAVPAERVVDGIVNTLGSDGKWTPASQMRWKVGTDAHYFLGVSPVRAVSDFTADAFTLTADEAANDLLFAKRLEGLTPGTTPVALSFAHAMARLTVNVKVRNEFGASPAVSVSVSAKSGATVNYLSGAVTATGDASERSLPAAASAPTGYTHSFGGIQVPQDGVRTITLTVAGKEFVYEAGEDIPLTSGHHTTLGLVVGKDKLELSGVSVSDWTAGSAIAGGEVAVTKINGRECVDMGNGLLWATCNVGAENPEDYGDYFAWGETAKKSTYNWSTYLFNPSGDGSTFTKYTTYGAILEAPDDAATVNWGSDWRTPTNAEWTWLRENCTWTWTTQNGVNGMLVTSFNGNRIFLPAAGYRDDAGLYADGSDGYYWSSSLNESYSNSARCVNFDSGGVDRDNGGRFYGQSVRPVLGPTPAPALGDLYYSDGTWSSTLVEGKTPIGVIAYLDQPGADDNEITESGYGAGHGLVLCMKNAVSDVVWSTETKWILMQHEMLDDGDFTRTNNVSGYSNTAKLTANVEIASKYPAAAAARNYTDLPAPAGTTGWFLPSAQQWARMMTGLGGLNQSDITWLTWFNNGHSAVTAWENAMAKAGAKGTVYDSMTDVSLCYWASSEYSENTAVLLEVNATGDGFGDGLYWNIDTKFGSTLCIGVRPVLAF